MEASMNKMHGIWGQHEVNGGKAVILSSLIKTLRFGKAKRNVPIGSQPMEQCNAPMSFQALSFHINP
jgi:hypothetical protein